MTPEDFNDLIQKNYDKFQHYTLNFTKNQDEREDLLHDTIFKALRYRSNYKHESNFKSWVYTIMKNTYINEYRKSMRWSPIQNKETSELILNTQFSNAEDPIENISKNEIQKAIATLKDNLKEVFKFYLEGYKYIEIAKMLHIPIGTVKSRIRLARLDLRDKSYLYSKY